MRSTPEQRAALRDVLCDPDRKGPLYEAISAVLDDLASLEDELERTRATCRRFAETIRGYAWGARLRRELDADQRSESPIDVMIDEEKKR